MLIVGLVYLVSLVGALLRVRQIERGFGAREGILWSLIFIPLLNTYMSIDLILNLLKKKD
jgi:hypothetical protein